MTEPPVIEKTKSSSRPRTMDRAIRVVLKRRLEKSAKMRRLYLDEKPAYLQEENQTGEDGDL